MVLNLLLAKLKTLFLKLEWLQLKENLQSELVAKKRMREEFDNDLLQLQEEK